MLPILILLSLTLILWFVYDRARCLKYPPGPIRIPLFGNLIQIARAAPYPHLAFQKLAKVYGDVIYARMGFTNAITFNSYETVRDILNHEHTTDRSQSMVPMIWERMQRKNLGLIFCNGKEWQTLRRFTIRTLRDFGFGKAASMDVVINEELEKFTHYLKTLNHQHPEGVDNAQSIFDLTIINVLWRLVTGIKYELNDANMLRLLKLSHEVLQSTNFAMDFSIAFPQLYHIFPEWMGKTNQIAKLSSLCDFVRETIEHHRKLGDYQTSPKCYVDEFLSKIDHHKGDPDTEFTDEQLVLCLLDLFQGQGQTDQGLCIFGIMAGADTSSNTMSFSMLYMILHPDVQEKVHAEIDMNVSKKDDIMSSTKEILPYTHATLLECIRHSVVVPIPGARQASADFYFNEYFVKKGTILLSNLYAVHFSESIWGEDVNNFRPERFLTSDGEVDIKMSNYLLPFGHGSRKCLASSLAENTLFLYFVTILRNFNIVKGRDAGELSMVPNLGLTHTPKPYKARFVPRI